VERAESHSAEGAQGWSPGIHPGESETPPSPESPEGAEDGGRQISARVALRG